MLIKELVLSIPVMYLMGMILAVSVFVLLGKLKMAITITYLSAFYWIFFLNRPQIEALSESPAVFMGPFIILGVIMVGILIWMFIGYSE